LFDKGKRLFNVSLFVAVSIKDLKTKPNACISQNSILGLMLKF
jgi:hypothetical protein